MRVEGGGTHNPSEESAYARKKRMRAAFARSTGYPVDTPWPVMGVKDSRNLGKEEVQA